MEPAPSVAPPFGRNPPWGVGDKDLRVTPCLLPGFDTKANPVEILYNEFGENGVNVFHAMPCRPRFYYLFENKETP